MPFRIGPTELIIILVVVLIIFGVGRLPEVGGAFGKAIRRPAFLKIPSFTLKLVFGEELSRVMLGGASMSSAKLESTGFQFRDHDLSVTLSNMLST